MAIIRKLTKEVHIADSRIGGNNPVLIQSMTNTDTRNTAETIAQIRRLEEAGCELVRVAVPDAEAAGCLREIKKNISIPLAADIHFDYRLALLSLENGVDKLRLNPGNIGRPENIRKVAEKARERGVPIRVGVNAGSLEKDLLEKHGGITPEALAESALRHVRILEDLDFDDIVVSLKASHVPVGQRAYEIMSEATRYPLHLGITEAGTLFSGSIKSAVGIGALLSQGIGDTIRVSLTGDSVEEVRVAKEILKALELRSFGVTVISCPTCGRTEYEMIPLANRVEDYCRRIQTPVTVAVMGCPVNGPGEARDADVGIAGGKGVGLLFRRGEIVRKITAESGGCLEDQFYEALIREIDQVVSEKK